MILHLKRTAKMFKTTITVIAQSLLISPLVILQPGVSHAQQTSQTAALNQARAGIEHLSPKRKKALKLSFQRGF